MSEPGSVDSECHFRNPKLIMTPSSRMPLRGHPVTLGTASSDAGSLYVYEKMRKTNRHGELGGAHMVDVDRMSGPSLTYTSKHD